MTQEDKILLLEDLCARLPYGVIVDYKDDEYDHHKWKITTLFAPAYSQDGTLIDTDHDGWIGYDDYKGCGMSSGARPLHIEKNLPYLRPFDRNMTGDEVLEYISLKEQIIACDDITYSFETSKSIDWLNKNMFDYRGLIPKGLAIEAPEGMYN